MTESQLHKQITDYIHLQYPKVIFNTDMAGERFGYGQAKKVKSLRSSNGFPDISIYEPTNNRFLEKHYCGLFLEVKKETPFKKDGILKIKKVAIYKKVKGGKNVLIGYKYPLQEQAEMHAKLNEKGYYACFVWTFDGAKTIIDNYLKL